MTLGGGPRRPIFFTSQTQAIIMTYVTSSNLQAVDYDSLTATLTIEFHSGRCYQYHGGTETIYQQLLSAASKGHFFSSFIRDRFTTTRIA
jgi:hypothetical protein